LVLVLLVLLVLVLVLLRLAQNSERLRLWLAGCIDLWATAKN
jgi:hypothetical protein